MWRVLVPIRHTFAISPHVFFARGIHLFHALSNQRAQGKPDARCTRGLVCDLHNKTCTRAYRFSGEHPAFPAQGRVWGSKTEINQYGAVDVSTFVSRSAGAIDSCAKFGASCDGAAGRCPVAQRWRRAVRASCGLEADACFYVVI